MIASAMEFIRLRSSEHMHEYNRAAHEPAPLSVWWELVSNHPEMRSWVAHNKTVPLEILEALSLDTDAAVRSVVAGKRKASQELLARLAKDPDSSVRHRVAYNRSASAEVLQLLLHDDWDGVAATARARLRDLGTAKSR